MLPPVVALPNSQISFQDQRPSYDFSNGGQLNAPAAHAGVTTGLEQNAAVAGRLNILLLSGRERMAQNLAMVAEIFGAAIGVVRKPGESTASFAARLADAIASLPLDQRLKLEGQLARALSGAQLRMLLAAFKDPGGPDAAKLSVLIELARAKDGDLAARSVVTSYRQNAGEARTDLPPDGGSASNPLPEPPVANANEQQDVAKAATDGDAAIGQSDLKAGEPANSIDGMEEVSGQEPKAEEPGLDASADRGEGHGLPEEKNTAGAMERTGEIRDARSLQAALSREFATTEPQETVGTDGRPLADATGPVSASDVADDSEGDGIDRMRNAFKALIGEVLVETSAQERRQRAEDPPQAMLTLKGWREVDHLYPGMVADAATGRDRAMMADALRAVSADDANLAGASEGKSVEQGIEERARQAAAVAAVAFADQEAAGEHAAEARSGRSFPEALLSQWQMLGEQAGAGRAAPGAGAALAPPLALANYLFARDEDEPVEAGPQEEGRQGFSDSGAGEEKQSGEDAPGEDANAGDQTEALADAEQPMTAHLTRSPESDRANDLYWRMAGWS